MEDFRGREVVQPCLPATGGQFSLFPPYVLSEAAGGWWLVAGGWPHFGLAARCVMTRGCGVWGFRAGGPGS